MQEHFHHYISIRYCLMFKIIIPKLLPNEEWENHITQDSVPLPQEAKYSVCDVCYATTWSQSFPRSNENHRRVPCTVSGKSWTIVSKDDLLPVVLRF